MVEEMRSLEYEERESDKGRVKTVFGILPLMRFDMPIGCENMREYGSKCWRENEDETGKGRGDGDGNESEEASK